MISNKCRSEHSDERDESEASAAVSRGRPSLPPDEDKTTIRFNLDHAGAHFPGTLLSNVPARGWAGGAKVVGDCGRSAEDAGNESLLSRNPRGQSLLEVSGRSNWSPMNHASSGGGVDCHWVQAPRGVAVKRINATIGCI